MNVLLFFKFYVLKKPFKYLYIAMDGNIKVVPVIYALKCLLKIFHVLHKNYKLALEVLILLSLLVFYMNHNVVCFYFLLLLWIVSYWRLLTRFFVALLILGLSDFFLSLNLLLHALSLEEFWNRNSSLRLLILRLSLWQFFIFINALTSIPKALAEIRTSGFHLIGVHSVCCILVLIRVLEGNLLLCWLIQKSRCPLLFWNKELPMLLI